MDAASFFYWSGFIIPLIVALAWRTKILGNTSLKMYFYAFILFAVLEGVNSLLFLFFSSDEVHQRLFHTISHAAYDGIMILLIHKMMSWVDPHYLERMKEYVIPFLLTGFLTAMITEYGGVRLGIFFYEETCLNPYLFDSVSLFPVISVALIVPCIFVFMAKIRHRLA